MAAIAIAAQGIAQSRTEAAAIVDTAAAAILCIGAGVVAHTVAASTICCICLLQIRLLQLNAMKLG